MDTKSLFSFSQPSTPTMEVRVLERESDWWKGRKRMKLREILVERDKDE